MDRFDKFYIITKAENIPQILHEGILPQHNEQNSSVNKHLVYITDNIGDLEHIDEPNITGWAVIELDSSKFYPGELNIIIPKRILYDISLYGESNEIKLMSGGPLSDRVMKRQIYIEYKFIIRDHIDSKCISKITYIPRLINQIRNDIVPYN